MLKHSKNLITSKFVRTYSNIQQNVVTYRREENDILFLLICSLIVSISTMMYFIQVSTNLIAKVDILVADARGNNYEDTFDSEQSVEQDMFDERIALMKEELYQQQEVREFESTQAEELHPDITNLPHNKIPYDKVPDVEYAE